MDDLNELRAELARLVAMKASGSSRNSYAMGCVHLVDSFTASLLRALEDAERLEYLEAQAHEDPLLLHALPTRAVATKDLRGLGLKCTGRTPRQAIDDMRRGDKFADARARAKEGRAGAEPRVRNDKGCKN